MRRVVVALLLGFAMLAPGKAFARDIVRADHPCARGTLVEGVPVAGGTADGFRLAGDERIFALADIAADKAVPMPAVSRLQLAMRGEPDRYGRHHVHAFGEEWVQGRLLAAGDALADPPHDGTVPVTACATALLAAESGTTALAAADTETLLQQAGRYRIVTGRVSSVGDRERTLYLNFGTNWREDFTIIVSKAKRGGYVGNLERLKSLAGRRITVRGTIEANGGPAVRLYDEAHVTISQ